MALAVATPLSVQAQNKDVPIRKLSAPVTAIARFSNSYLSVTELPDGRAMIRDNGGRRLVVLDTSLAKSTIVADNEGSNGTFFPQRGFSSPFLQYRGDTTLLVDLVLPGFVAITPEGRVGTIMSHPVSKDLMATGQPDGMSSGFDNLGRFIYRAYIPRPIPQPGDSLHPNSRDTIAIVRADLDKRSVDTIASYGIPRTPGIIFKVDPVTGKQTVSQILNPFPMGPDGWAVLSTGTLGIVRSHDYHVDWIHSDGTKAETPKLPFDWKRLTDDDKEARIDSMKRVIDSLNLSPTPYKYGVSFFNRRSPDGKIIGVDTVRTKISFVPLNQMPDYVPPIRENAVKADRDGNMWILPATSARAQGGLLYDVVNEKAGLYQRVQLPSDCVLVGFGKKGVVFLARREEKEWVLERRRIQ